MAEIAGLKLIVPSSVAGSGVSVSASGKVTFTAATDISVNGVFDGTFDNYLVVCRFSHTEDRGQFMRLRASGSDASGANYTYQTLDADGTSTPGARTTNTSNGFLCNDSGSGISGSHLYLYGPYLAQPTALRDVSASSRNTVRIQDVAATHSLSTSYDGFTLLRIGSATITGSLTVYGLSQ